jgi:hypothetical protein
MAFKIRDRVRESSTTTGTGPFTLNGAANGYQSFGSVLTVGDTTQGLISQPGGSWVTGLFTYSAANQITVTTVYESSNAGAIPTFGAGTKDILISQPAQGPICFPSGTALPFYNASAPIGWTKSTANNDKALRVVSGVGGVSGGTNAFSSVMAQTVVGSTTITQATMPSHTHSVAAGSNGLTYTTAAGGGVGIAAIPQNSTSAGSDGAHNHTIALSIAYVDLIIASKD